MTRKPVTRKPAAAISAAGRGELMCQFCSAPWAQHAHFSYDDAELYENGVGTPDICITITCSSCQKVMFQRDSIPRDPS